MSSDVQSRWHALSAGFKALPPKSRYGGLERRRGDDLLGTLFTLAIDELDLGLIVTDAEGGVAHANRMAQRRLAGPQALSLDGTTLRCAGQADQLKLQAAIRAAACEGLRRLLTLGNRADWIALSVIPLSPLTQGPAWSGALLLLGKSQLCENLSLHAFAREFGLTAAEQEVLRGLCAGLQPQDIAQRNSVALSTIRTQIASVRGKTRAESIRELIGMVALLPPMLSVQPMR